MPGAPSLQRAIQARELEARWAARPPSKQELMEAVSCACDVTQTSDAEAAYVVDLLLERGLQPDAPLVPWSPPTTSDSFGKPCSALHVALWRPVVLARLLPHTTPAALNAMQPGFNTTLLHLATMHFATCGNLRGSVPMGPSDTRATCQRRVLECVRLLLAAGADPFVPSEAGDIPLQRGLEVGAVTGETELIMLLFTAMHGDTQAAEFGRALKLTPDQLIAELRQLATKARPVSSSSELAGVLELPPDAQAHAEMLMTVAQDKLSTYHRKDIFPRYDQLLQLLPLAGVAALYPHFFRIAQTLAVDLASAVSPSDEPVRPDSNVLFRRFANPHERPEAWLNALHTNPGQLCLYAMLRWNKLLHDQLLARPAALKKAAQGTKTLIAYANSVIARARATSSSSRPPGKPKQQSAATILARKLPGFQDMALGTDYLLSWMVIEANLEDVPDRPELFLPLVQVGHHLDALTLLGMGHAKAILAAASLCHFPQAAFDMLLRVAENGGANDVATQVAGIVSKMTARVAAGKTIDGMELLPVRHSGALIRGITVNLLFQLYEHSDKAQAARMLAQALPAIASLKGSAVADALAAVRTLEPEQFVPLPGLSAGMPGVARAMAGDARKFLEKCMVATAAIEWAASRAAAAAVASAASAATAGTGDSSSSSSHWSPSVAQSVLERGLHSIAEAAGCGGITFALDASGAPQVLLPLPCLRRVCDVSGDTPPGVLHGRGTAVGRALAHEGSRPVTNAACWGCGLSAQEAAAAGQPVARGPDGKPKLKCCSRCRVAFYCCPACQKQHWRAHRVTCQPAA